MIQKNDEITLNQRAFAMRLLKDQQMMDINPSATPLAHKIKLRIEGNLEKVRSSVFWSIVGQLLYPTHTRLDVMFSVGS